MCEFRVYSTSDPTKRIAEDVVRATVKNGSLSVNKILGESLTLENTLILEVDVPKERLVVSQSSLSGCLVRLIESISSFQKNPSPATHEKVLALWDQMKSEGESVIKSLKYKG